MKKSLIAITLLCLTGCSTMFNGTSQTIQASTASFKNSDILVTLPTTQYVKPLPSELNIPPLESKLPITITPIGDCIKPIKVAVHKELANSYWLNALNGIGFFIDYATGAMWQYPESVKVGVYRKDHCHTDKS